MSLEYTASEILGPNHPDKEPASATMARALINKNNQVILNLSEVETPEELAAIMALVPEAPSDSKQYARKNAAWEEVEAGAAGSTTPTIIASESSVVFGLAVAGDVTYALPANPAAGDKAKYYITLTGTDLTFDIDAAILLPSDSGLTLPKTFTSTKTYIVQFEFNGTAWMLTSLIGGY